MTVSKEEKPTMRTRFENLPDELILSMLNYLSPVEIFSSFLDLNRRFNRTITFYRENIFLGHLSREEFELLTKTFLKQLADQVRSLTISDRSAIGLSRIFETEFLRIDHEFPLLRKLVFKQINIEVLENISWRFNSIRDLQELVINIADNHLSEKKILFNDYLCGKLFSSSNTFEKLSVDCDQHFFRLSNVNTQCRKLRFLSLRILSLNDLVILFDNLPNIVELKVRLPCQESDDKTVMEYRYDQLWWKVPALERFKIQIEDNSLINHKGVPPSYVLSEIIRSIYLLRELEVNICLRFSQTLRESTTKEIFAENYNPFINGSFWESCLERTDRQKIQFDLNVEIDAGIPRRRESSAFVEIFPNETSINLCESLKPTITSFQTDFWMKQNVQTDISLDEFHYSLSTFPSRQATFDSSLWTIRKQMYGRYSKTYHWIKKLQISSITSTNADNFNSSALVFQTISATDLFRVYPKLTELSLNEQFNFLPSTKICSNNLRSLSISNQSFLHLKDFLHSFPQLRELSLQLTNIDFEFLENEFLNQRFSSVKILNLSCNFRSSLHILNFIQSFTNLFEFYLSMSESFNESMFSLDPYVIFSKIVDQLHRARFIETTFTLNVRRELIKNWTLHGFTTSSNRTRNFYGRTLQLSQWN